MILRHSDEVLVSTHRKEDAVTLRYLAEQARELGRGWENNQVLNSGGSHFQVMDDLSLQFINDRGENKTMDMTETAFSQLCTRLGVPPKYIQKCADAGKHDLVMQNFREWAADYKDPMVIREHGGVARAVMSVNYVPFESYKILRELSHTVDSKRFVPAQVYLSTDKLHVRFVDFTPLSIPGEKSPVYAGFCVDSSDVGRGSLSMKYFLYRLACTNGLMISRGAGTLFRLWHSGEVMTASKIEKFCTAMRDIDKLTGEAVELIGYSQGRMLKGYELEFFLEKARREMKLSEKSVEKIQYLMGEDGPYNQSKWGLINSVTELARDFTLDRRVELESWAGDLLYKAA